jgi:hypothetical protein
MRLHLLISQKKTIQNFGIGKNERFWGQRAKEGRPGFCFFSDYKEHWVGAWFVLCCSTCTLIFLLCFCFSLGNALVEIKLNDTHVKWKENEKHYGKNELSAVNETCSLIVVL